MQTIRQHRVDILGEIVEVGLAEIPCDGMLLDEPVLVKDLDHLFSDSDLDGFADIGVWHRVYLFVNLDMLIGMHFGLFPAGQLKRAFRQGFESRFLVLEKNDIGLLAGGAMLFPAIRLHQPAEDGPVGLSQSEMGVQG